MYTNYLYMVAKFGPIDAYYLYNSMLLNNQQLRHNWTQGKHESKAAEAD